MVDNNEQLMKGNIRITSAKIIGLFILVSVLIIIIGVVIYSKQLVEKDLFIASSITIAIVLSTIFWFIWKLVRKLDEAYTKMELMAITDGLTQLYNKNYFNTLFKIELSRAIRHERNLSIYVLDIDYFMTIIDTYGHQFGNEVLQETADVIKDNSRSTDIVARYNRDKFICLLPETDIASAMILAKRLRALIEGEIFSYGEDSETVPVNVCIGVTFYEPSLGKEIDINHLMNIVDKALSVAKSNGRNRVEFLVCE
jgi:diguanylate cyclase (GGDEF)-like protein